MPSLQELHHLVLVVDDDENILTMMREMLAGTTIEVVTAQTCRDALQALDEQDFDLMVTDVVLGEEITGLELARYARITQPEMKCLFVSGLLGPVIDDPDRDDFVHKPFRGRELLGCVYELMRRQSPERHRRSTAERAADLAKAALKVAGARSERTGGDAAAASILVVDDDEAVMEIAATMIEELGFAVLRATSGSVALQLLDDNPSVILLITDIVMPGMDGWALAREARHRNPDLKALYMSGFIKPTGSLPPDEYGPVLAKPWRSQQLYEAVTEVLAAR